MTGTAPPMLTSDLLADHAAPHDLITRHASDVMGALGRIVDVTRSSDCLKLLARLGARRLRLAARQSIGR
jgi:hypothetical protein